MANSGEQSRPNLLFVLVDDLGWMDTAHYGSDYYETPNIDRLGEEGLTFTDAHAANPLCSPTRASILTGQHPARVGITAPVCHQNEERLEGQLQDDVPSDQRLRLAESATRLDTEYTTLIDTLGDAGYRTGHFGKWHLGHEPYDALGHGFDVDVPNAGVPSPGPRGYYAPWDFWPDQGTPGQHIDDAITDEAIDFIEEHADGNPFFCNYWSFCVHTPIEGDLDLVEKYIEKRDPDSPQNHPIYAAMVETLDRNVGRLLDTLEEQHIRDETLIVFTADHGGVNWAPDPPGSGGRIQVTSNEPLRGGKASAYEGGTRVPLIVSWPGEVPQGKHSESLVSSVDFYPTLCDALGIELPGDHFLDGTSFTPAFRDEPVGRGPAFCHFPHDVDVHPDEGPSVYVRADDWKLIRFFHDSDSFKHRHELYNLDQDRSEREDLSEENPELVDRLSGLLDEFLEETDAVIPEPNPAYEMSTS